MTNGVSAGAIALHPKAGRGVACLNGGAHSAVDKLGVMSDQVVQFRVQYKGERLGACLGHQRVPHS